jgi:hypothetical protein
MVDGMGMSGTQGVFQRCAEETLRVLREGSEVITTVLEVFKHDPLHQWCVQFPPKRKKKKKNTLIGVAQDRERGQGAQSAERGRQGSARRVEDAVRGDWAGHVEHDGGRGGGPRAHVRRAQAGQGAQRRVHGERAHCGSDGRGEPRVDLLW